MNEQIFVNPISQRVKQSIKRTSNNLKIAVPFITSFAKTIIDKRNVSNISEKKILTRFDDTNISSFDIPTLDYLLKCGFEIRFDNDIHLKLYITDDQIFISSSNMTKGGFENNKELTVKIDQINYVEVNKIFASLWINARENIITDKMLKDNIAKYWILKKRNKFKTGKTINISETQLKVGSLKLSKLINGIFNSKKEYSKRLAQSFNANTIRENIKNELLVKKFKKTIFYAPQKHPMRFKNLFYYFVYGDEEKLAGTGLREAQFKAAFRHKDFEKVVAFIFPEMYGLDSWNLEDEKTYNEFCNGLFDFKIPQYSEALPIRMASFFYPEYFLPIFNLKHLQKICDSIGMKTDATTKGDRLFAYNIFLRKKMKAIPHNNYIKSNIAYQILYCVELYKGLQSGKKYEAIKKEYKKHWIQKFIEEGLETLLRLQIIKKVK